MPGRSPVAIRPWRCVGRGRRTGGRRGGARSGRTYAVVGVCSVIVEPSQRDVLGVTWRVRSHRRARRNVVKNEPESGFLWEEGTGGRAAEISPAHPWSGPRAGASPPRAPRRPPPNTSPGDGPNSGRCVSWGPPGLCQPFTGSRSIGRGLQAAGLQSPRGERPVMCLAPLIWQLGKPRPRDGTWPAQGPPDGEPQGGMAV